MDSGLLAAGLAGDLLFRGEEVFLGERFLLDGDLDLGGVLGCFLEGEDSAVSFVGEAGTETLGNDICAFFLGDDLVAGEPFLPGVVLAGLVVLALLGVGWSSFLDNECTCSAIGMCYRLLMIHREKQTHE